MELIWPDQQLRAWLPERVNLCATTRVSGFSSPPFGRGNLALHVGDDIKVVQRNRECLLQQMPGSNAIQWLQQIHGTACGVASGGRVTPTCDSVYTREPGIACAVLTADCLPILLMNRSGDEIAAVHAGWRGLAAGAIQTAIDRFSASSQLLAVIGPAIGFDAFEVGEEVKAAFQGAPEQVFQALGNGKFLADLNAIAIHQLQKAGVQCFVGMAECTVERNDRFYSYRKEGQTGRMASLIWIES